MSDAKVTAWLRSGKYLPPFLRDFHDQKGVFKAVHEVVERRANDLYTRDLSWITAQVYVIDVFLWMMARHGYTLQRSRKKLPYSDLNEWLSGAKERRDQALAPLILRADLTKSEA